MALLNIAGGVALILFGIRFLRKGLERLFGYRLYSWIEKTAQRPWKAAIAGFAFGTMAPSSTAQTLISLQLLRAGKLSHESILGFLLGANLGITVTVQLIALRIFEYYAVFIVVGLIGFLWGRREEIRGFGQTILSLGFIFLAMQITSEAAAVLTKNPDFVTLLGVLIKYRVLIVIFAAVMTLTMQSSTAIIGLGLAIAGTGAAQLDLMVPLILGSNLGIGLTSLLVGFSSWEGRRLVLANLLLKGMGIALIFSAFSWVVVWTAASPGSIARQSANFHSAFNLVVTMAGVIFAGPIGKLIRRAVKPAPPVPGAVHLTTHLDPAALQTPVFALANATRETLRLADTVKGMFEGAWQAVLSQNATLAQAVQRQDDRVDELNASIKVYLSQIPAESLTVKDRQLQFGLLNFSSQLETIGDVIDKSLCGTVREHAHENISIQPADQADLDELDRRLMHRFGMAISVLATRDRNLAKEFLADGDKLKEWVIAAQKRHYVSLAAGDPSVVEASTRFLDTFNVLRRISGQLNTIGHTFVLD